MTAINATALTLKISTDNTNQNFVELGGVENYRMQLRNQNANHHHANLEHPWRTANDQTGQQALTITGDGIFTNSASEAYLRNQAFSNKIRNFQIELGNGNTITGVFAITQLAFSAAMEGAIRYQIALQSAGELRYE